MWLQAAEPWHNQWCQWRSELSLTKRLNFIHSIFILAPKQNLRFFLMRNEKNWINRKLVGAESKWTVQQFGPLSRFLSFWKWDVQKEHYWGKLKWFDRNGHELYLQLLIVIQEIKLRLTRFFKSICITVDGHKINIPTLFVTQDFDFTN